MGPVAYVVDAVLTLGFGGASRAAFYGVRLLGAIELLVFAGLIGAVVRRSLPADEHAAVFAMACVLFNPMLLTMAASVQNDILALCLATGALVAMTGESVGRATSAALWLPRGSCLDHQAHRLADRTGARRESGTPEEVAGGIHLRLDRHLGQRLVVRPQRIPVRRPHRSPRCNGGRLSLSAARTLRSNRIGSERHDLPVATDRVRPQRRRRASMVGPASGGAFPRRGVRCCACRCSAVAQSLRGHARGDCRARRGDLARDVLATQAVAFRFAYAALPLWFLGLGGLVLLRGGRAIAVLVLVAELCVSGWFLLSVSDLSPLLTRFTPEGRP